MLETQQLRAHALLEHQDQQTIRSAHGEEVHCNGLDGNDYRPEYQHQYDEAEAQHEREDDGRICFDYREDVRGLRGHTTDQGFSINPSKSGRDVLVADSGHYVHGRLAAGLPGDDYRQQGQIPGGIDLRGNGWDQQAAIAHERGLQLSNGLLHAGAVYIAVDDDFCGVDQPEGELLLHYEESLPSLGAFGEGVNPVEPRLDVEVEEDCGKHRDAYSQDADDGEPGYLDGYELPEPMPLGL